MEFIYQSGNMICLHEKAEIAFLAEDVLINKKSIQFPWEYEIADVIVRVQEFDGIWMYAFRLWGLASGKNVAYLPQEIQEFHSDMTEFLGDIDILLIPPSKTLSQTLEALEPRMILLFWAGSQTTLQTLSGNSELLTKFKPKESDFQAERAPVFAFGQE